jgi:hypothetical protein
MLVLVPRKPTKKMLRAACSAMSPGKRPTSKRVSVKAKHGIRYRAMVDAYLEESTMTKLQINMPDDLHDRLTKIMDEAGVEDIGELIRQSLTLYAAAIEAKKRGQGFYVRGKSGEEIPCFIGAQQ